MTETRVHPKVSPVAAEAAVELPEAPPTGDETVDEIVDQHPDLRLVLMSYGLCTCCSGGLTLRQNAEAHGVPLAVILLDLERELAKGA